MGTHPSRLREWRVDAARAGAVALKLSKKRELALLFRTLATLRTDVALFVDVEDLKWTGPSPAFANLAARLDAAVITQKRTSPRSIN